MTTSHAAAAAVAAYFLERNDPKEDDVELFYAEVFPRLPESQREVIFEWILASVDEVTQEDVLRLMKTLASRSDFDASSVSPSAADLSIYAHGM